MKNYDNLMIIVKKVERDLFGIADLNIEQKQGLINILENVRIVRDRLQMLIDDQEAETQSMIEEFKNIEKLNDKLGKMLNDK